MSNFSDYRAKFYDSIGPQGNLDEDKLFEILHGPTGGIGPQGQIVENNEYSKTKNKSKKGYENNNDKNNRTS
jgi:hypothetical protein